MKFLREWLRIERPAGVGLHASQSVDLEGAYGEVFARTLRGIEEVLGGVVRSSDERAGLVEATFGLVDSERLTCSISRIDAARTRVRIESRRGARAEPAQPSPYVRALARFLQSEASE